MMIGEQLGVEHEPQHSTVYLDLLSEGVAFPCTSDRYLDDLIDHSRRRLPLHHQPPLVHAVLCDYVPELFEVQ